MEKQLIIRQIITCLLSFLCGCIYMEIKVGKIFLDIYEQIQKNKDKFSDDFIFGVIVAAESVTERL